MKFNQTKLKGARNMAENENEKRETAADVIERRWPEFVKKMEEINLDRVARGLPPYEFAD